MRMKRKNDDGRCTAVHRIGVLADRPPTTPPSTRVTFLPAIFADVVFHGAARYASCVRRRRRMTMAAVDGDDIADVEVEDRRQAVIILINISS